ncbi:MAG: polyprenyl synthetase family protein [Acidimicrobiia bacterium]|nr:polyprenyl synthetase family protein [Acidimicrobiia bacterium]
MQPLQALGIAPLAADLERVEVCLRESARSQDPLLSDIASHLILAGGKRLRPALTLCAAYATTGVSPVSDDVITGAVAVELVHLGSLYHDDVIDEAQTRRGVPSVNARWSNIVAILAGDYLLARASELAASLGAQVAALLAATIGELCRGQVLELAHLFDVDRSEEIYFSAIDGKTASLFGTACRIGGMVSNADDATLDALTNFGKRVGTCFQIVDDVLDVTGDEATLGKPAGNDLEEGIYTLPVIYAIDREPKLRDMLGRKLDADQLEAARNLATSDGAVARALKMAQQQADQANEALGTSAGLDDDVTAGLRRLVDTLVTREN